MYHGLLPNNTKNFFDSDNDMGGFKSLIVFEKKSISEGLILRFPNSTFELCYLWHTYRDMKEIGRGRDGGRVSMKGNVSDLFALMEVALHPDC